MDRPILGDVSDSVRERQIGYHSTVLDEVRQAVASADVVVVGMAQNPSCAKAHRRLEAAGVPHTYLVYGSYFSAWKPRLAIKMWSGWPTFPQVFVQGALIGGCDDLVAALDDGSLQARLDAGRA